MKIDWSDVLDRFRKYPPGLHEFLPPCSSDRIEATEKELGKLPPPLVDMLRHFNGAKLFRLPGPVIRMFGISTIPPLPEMEWSLDYCIDNYTTRWRTSPKRKEDWAIGIWNYGGLVILDSEWNTREWDKGTGEWNGKKVPFDKWIQSIFKRGDKVMKELADDP